MWTPAYDDEIFGPVASIIRARDDEDAMRLANESRSDRAGVLFSPAFERPGGEKPSRR